MQHHQIFFFDTEQRVSPTVVYAKFDLVGGFSERLYYGTDVSPDYFFFRYISKQGDHIQVFAFR